MKTSALRIEETVSSPSCCFNVVNVLNIVKDVQDKLKLGRSQTISTTLLQTNEVN